MTFGSEHEGHTADETWLTSTLLKLQSQVRLFGWQWQTTSYWSYCEPAVPHATLSFKLHACTVPLCVTVCVSHLIVPVAPLVLLAPLVPLVPLAPLVLPLLEEEEEEEEELDPLASAPEEPSAPPSPWFVAVAPEHATVTSAEPAIKVTPCRFVSFANISLRVARPAQKRHLSPATPICLRSLA